MHKTARALYALDPIVGTLIEAGINAVLSDTQRHLGNDGGNFDGGRYLGLVVAGGGIETHESSLAGVAILIVVVLISTGPS